MHPRAEPHRPFAKAPLHVPTMEFPQEFGVKPVVLNQSNNVSNSPNKKLSKIDPEVEGTNNNNNKNEQYLRANTAPKGRQQQQQQQQQQQNQQSSSSSSSSTLAPPPPPASARTNRSQFSIPAPPSASTTTTTTARNNNNNNQQETSRVTTARRVMTGSSVRSTNTQVAAAAAADKRGEFNLSPSHFSSQLDKMAVCWGHEALPASMMSGLDFNASAGSGGGARKSSARSQSASSSSTTAAAGSQPQRDPALVTALRGYLNRELSLRQGEESDSILEPHREVLRVISETFKAFGPLISGAVSAFDKAFVDARSFKDVASELKSQHSYETRRLQERITQLEIQLSEVHAKRVAAEQENERLVSEFTEWQTEKEETNVNLQESLEHITDERDMDLNKMLTLIRAVKDADLRLVALQNQNSRLKVDAEQSAYYRMQLREAEEKNMKLEKLYKDIIPRSQFESARKDFEERIQKLEEENRKLRHMSAARGAEADRLARLVRQYSHERSVTLAFGDAQKQEENDDFEQQQEEGGGAGGLKRKNSRKKEKLITRDELDFEEGEEDDLFYNSDDDYNDNDEEEDDDEENGFDAGDENSASRKFGDSSLNNNNNNSSNVPPIPGIAILASSSGFLRSGADVNNNNEGEGGENEENNNENNKKNKKKKRMSKKQRKLEREKKERKRIAAAAAKRWKQPMTPRPEWQGAALKAELSEVAPDAELLGVETTKGWVGHLIGRLKAAQKTIKDYDDAHRPETPTSLAQYTGGLGGARGGGGRLAQSRLSSFVNQLPTGTMKASATPSSSKTTTLMMPPGGGGGGSSGLGGTQTPSGGGGSSLAASHLNLTSTLSPHHHHNATTGGPLSVSQMATSASGVSGAGLAPGVSVMTNFGGPATFNNPDRIAHFIPTQRRFVLLLPNSRLQFGGAFASSAIQSNNTNSHPSSASNPNASSSSSSSSSYSTRGGKEKETSSATADPLAEMFDEASHQQQQGIALTSSNFEFSTHMVSALPPYIKHLGCVRVMNELTRKECLDFLWKFWENRWKFLTNSQLTTSNVNQIFASSSSSSSSSPTSLAVSGGARPSSGQSQQFSTAPTAPFSNFNNNASSNYNASGSLLFSASSASLFNLPPRMTSTPRQQPLAGLIRAFAKYTIVDRFDGSIPHAAEFAANFLNIMEKYKESDVRCFIFLGTLNGTLPERLIFDMMLHIEDVRYEARRVMAGAIHNSVAEARQQRQQQQQESPTTGETRNSSRSSATPTQLSALIQQQQNAEGAVGGGGGVDKLQRRVRKAVLMECIGINFGHKTSSNLESLKIALGRDSTVDVEELLWPTALSGSHFLELLVGQALDENLELYTNLVEQVTAISASFEADEPTISASDLMECVRIAEKSTPVVVLQDLCRNPLKKAKPRLAMVRSAREKEQLLLKELEKQQAAATAAASGGGGSGSDGDRKSVSPTFISSVPSSTTPTAGLAMPEEDNLMFLDDVLAELSWAPIIKRNDYNKEEEEEAKTASKKKR